MSAIKAGWLYSGPLRSEQSQGWYVPVMDKDGTLKLVDTYVIKACYSKHDKNVSAMTDAILEMGTEPHPYVFSRVLSDYYYGSRCIYHVGDELPEDFEEVCYLPDWEYVNDREAEDYEPCDVVWYVQLYFEHGFKWHGYRHGVCLKRKGAMKSFDRQLDAAISDAHRSMTYPSTGYAVSAAIRLHEDGTRSRAAGGAHRGQADHRPGPQVGRGDARDDGCRRLRGHAERASVHPAGVRAIARGHPAP